MFPEDNFIKWKQWLPLCSLIILSITSLDFFTLISASGVSWKNKDLNLFCVSVMGKGQKHQNLSSSLPWFYTASFLNWPNLLLSNYFHLNKDTEQKNCVRVNNMTSIMTTNCNLWNYCWLLGHNQRHWSGTSEFLFHFSFFNFYIALPSGGPQNSL